MVGTHIGGGITDTIRTISSRTIIPANITATTMPSTITMNMQRLTMAENIDKAI